MLFRSLPKAGMHVIGEASRLFEFEGLDHYIQYADHIVVGTVTGVSEFDESTGEYAVSVDRQLKANTASKAINVYALKDRLEINGQYLCFLEAFEGGLYPSKRSIKYLTTKPFLNSMANGSITAINLYQNHADLKVR